MAETLLLLSNVIDADRSYVKDAIYTRNTSLQTLMMSSFNNCGQLDRQAIDMQTIMIVISMLVSDQHLDKEGLLHDVYFLHLKKLN